MNNTHTPDLGALVSLHQEALKKMRRARKTVTIGLVAVILGALFCLFGMAKNFMNHGVHEFSANLQRDIQPIASRHLTSLQDILADAYPVYTGEFQNMFSDNLPKMEAALFAELTRLDGYAKKRWPEFEKAIERMAFDQQLVIHQNLVSLVGEDEADRISKMYEVALPRKFNGFFLDHLIEHQDVIDDIRQNLDRLVKTEPDILPPIQLQEAIGIFLELAGIKLQEEV